MASGMNALAGNSPVVREGQTFEQLSRLVSVVDDLEQQMSSLEGRLSPVLRNEPETPEKNVAAPKECLVPLADAIRTQAERLYRVRSNLDDLRGRIEV